MQVFKDLFSSDIGLMSLATISIVIVMAIYFVRFFQRQMKEDESKLTGR
jgi:heme/copper-type cytochrome/quinol oxidase subunit 2